MLGSSHVESAEGSRWSPSEAWVRCAFPCVWQVEAPGGRANHPYETSGSPYLGGIMVLILVSITEIQPKSHWKCLGQRFSFRKVKNKDQIYILFVKSVVFSSHCKKSSVWSELAWVCCLLVESFGDTLHSGASCHPWLQLAPVIPQSSCKGGQVPADHYPHLCCH